MPHMQKKNKKARRRRRGDEISDDGDHYGEDLLSELPDEILVSIISRLTLRQAARTSVLSRRWRYLWTYTSRLNFDSVVNKIVRQPHYFAFSTTKRQRKYVKWVHKVLTKYRGGQNLDEFRVCFDLSKTSRSDIDKWFEFAMSKNVKSLEFDFLRCSLLKSPWDWDWDPTNFKVLIGYFHLISGLRKAWAPPMNPNCMYVGFKSLKTLSLKSINVSNEAVEYFLSNCPLLERLSVHGSSSLVNLRVAGPSIMLRHLEIVKCSYIQTIEICDTNLVSFTYWGDAPPNNILLKNVPILVEVSVDVGTLGLVKNMLHQLRILQLTVNHFRPEQLSAYLLPKLRNLKQLELIVFGNKNCFLGFVALLKKCPHLESFVLQLKRPYKTVPVATKYDKASISYSHKYLKAVKIVGFKDSSNDCELVMQIIENAIALEKIIIDPSQGHRKRAKRLKIELAARTRAEQLKLHLPPNLEFIIL